MLRFGSILPKLWHESRQLKMENSTNSLGANFLNRIAAGERKLDKQQLDKIGLSPEDSELFTSLPKLIDHPVSNIENQRRALFYPSAGNDFALPILIGLSRCTDFFFYDFSCYRARRQGQNRSVVKLTQLLESLEIDYNLVHRTKDFVFHCKIAGVHRSFWLLAENNLKFLEWNITLSTYFHRGDSWGEGGSGQEWDSQLLPILLQKSCPQEGCFVLTDGQPGDLAEETSTLLTALDQSYYTGVLYPPIKK